MSYTLDPSTLPENYRQLLEEGTGVKITYVLEGPRCPFAKVYGKTQDLAKVLKTWKWIVGLNLPNYCGTLA